MNKMREVAELLGLEWNEEEGRSEIFKVHGGLHHHYFKEDGLMRSIETNVTKFCVFDLLLGKFEIKKLPWKPKYNERYWTIDFLEKDNVRNTRNLEQDDDVDLISLGLAFRTKEEAQKVAEIMLKSLEGLE